MPDAPIGTAPPPTVTVVPGNAPAQAPGAARAAKLAAVKDGLAKLQAGGAEAKPATPAATAGAAADVSASKLAGPTPAEAARADEKPAEADAKPEDKAADKPVEAKPDDKADDKPDAQTAKAIAKIDARAKQFRDEMVKAKADFELDRAELARQTAEFKKAAGGFEDLQKLAKRDPIALLRKFGYDSEDDFELVGRAAFPLTKQGKTDPRTKEAADRYAKERGRDDDLASIREELAELKKEKQAAEQRAQGQAFVQKWTEEAVKAIPATPSLIGKLHAKSPEKARQALLETGARLERENDNTTPSHAEVIAEYERVRRAELEEQGVDVDALLKPGAAAAKPAPSKTLDVASPANGTRPINGNPSKAEKIAFVTAGLKKLSQESA